MDNHYYIKYKRNTGTIFDTYVRRPTKDEALHIVQLTRGPVDVIEVKVEANINGIWEWIAV